MGVVAKVLSFTRAARNGLTLQDVKLDPGGGAVITAEHSAPPGDDSAPLPGDYAAISAAAGTGRQTVVGYYDGKNAPKAEPGDKRTYARDSSGEVVVEIWLKNSGECLITNSLGTFELEPDGTFVINGLRITPNGNATTAAGVSLDGHSHTQGPDSDGNSQTATNPPTGL